MTTSDDRLARLTTDPVLREEADTLQAMVSLYCQHHHGTSDQRCPQCEAFLNYALKRLACCPYGAQKPVCAKCRIHCYRQAEKDLARNIMRWSGPRLTFTHPMLTLKHLVKSFTVTPPPKPKNRNQGKWHNALSTHATTSAFSPTLLRASPLPRRTTVGRRAPVDRFTALGRSAFSSATNADAGASLLRHWMGSHHLGTHNVSSRSGYLDSSGDWNLGWRCALYVAIGLGVSFANDAALTISSLWQHLSVLSVLPSSPDMMQIRLRSSSWVESWQVKHTLEKFAFQKNGDIYVYEQITAYDPVTKKTVAQQKTLKGKILAGTDVLVPTRP